MRVCPLTRVEEDEELEAGDLPAVHLQGLQLACQLLPPLHQTGEGGACLASDVRYLNLPDKTCSLSVHWVGGKG